MAGALIAWQLSEYKGPETERYITKTPPPQSFTGSAQGKPDYQ